MEPIATSNSYTQTPNRIAALYWGEIIRKRWYALLIFPTIILVHLINLFITNRAGFALLNCGVLFVIFFYVRYSFLSALRNNPTFHRSRILTVYPGRLEVEEEFGSKGVFRREEIIAVKSLKADYCVRMQGKRTFWIPKSCFKSEEDRLEFEKMFVQ